MAFFNNLRGNRYFGGRNLGLGLIGYLGWRNRDRIRSMFSSGFGGRRMDTSTSPIQDRLDTTTTGGISNTDQDLNSDLKKAV